MSVVIFQRLFLISNSVHIQVCIADKALLLFIYLSKCKISIQGSLTNLEAVLPIFLNLAFWVFLSFSVHVHKINTHNSQINIQISPGYEKSSEMYNVHVPPMKCDPEKPNNQEGPAPSRILQTIFHFTNSYQLLNTF